jgi:hypothetical protein
MSVGRAKEIAREWLRKHPDVHNWLDQLLYDRAIPIYNDITTMIPPELREYLFLLASGLNKGGNIVEIGCYAGGSTYFLGMGARKSGARVYSIDPFDFCCERQMEYGDGSKYLKLPEKPSRESVEQRLRQNGLNGEVTLIQGFSQEEARRWDKGPIQILWIDGNHHETREDYYAWRKHLSPKSEVLFHDTNYPEHGRKDVSDAVERIIREEGLIVLDRIGSLTTVYIE